MILVLKPGEFHFGSTGERIQTLLGSCVAITFWNPSERMGGMCHYLLPENPSRTNKIPDGRYADQSVELFLAELKRTKTRREDYQVKIFGGGNMFPNLSRNNTNDVGHRNINAARQLLKFNHFKIHSEHVGQAGHRTVILDLHTGYTWLRWQQD
ncbi:MAG: chemotaxis protein CheD [Motiliproteus sp.]